MKPQPLGLWVKQSTSVILLHKKLALKKRFGCALTQLFHQNLGKFGFFSPFVTVVRFEPSSHRITGEAFYFFAAEAQEISAKERFGRALTQLFFQKFWKLGHFS